MSELPKDGGPAFPIPPVIIGEKMWDENASDGMSLRDWFAGQVACGMAAFSGTAGISYGPGDIAGRSYVIADALLEARGK